MIDGKGSIEAYPCDCLDRGNPNAICWIVRHPDLNTPPMSYRTEHAAKTRLGQLRAQEILKIIDGKVT
jgi:hypothetical protein